MKLRHKEKGWLASPQGFNTHSLDEIIVGFEEGDMDSDHMYNYDIQLPNGEWKDLRQAFRDRDVIPNNHNTTFAFPSNDEQRQRGWY